MAHAESRGASSDSRLLGTGLSIGAHTVLVGLFLFGAIHAPQRGETVSVPVAPFNLEFLNRPGVAGGGGAGAANSSEPPRRIEIPVARRETLPLPTPSDTPPVPTIAIPVTTVNAVEMLPGAVADVTGTAPGQGRGPGSGTGGDGPGVGPGKGGGFGGNTYADGAVGVTSPRLIREIKPNYTADAVRRKVQGSVLLEAVVLPDGSVDPNRIRIVRSLDAASGLDQEAIHAVRAWHFRPGTFDGKPVSVRVLVDLTFTLR
jgi:protein TonB